jgi:hypothetical protein
MPRARVKIEGLNIEYIMHVDGKMPRVKKRQKYYIMVR